MNILLTLRTVSSCGECEYASFYLGSQYCRSGTAQFVSHLLIYMLSYHAIRIHDEVASGIDDFRQLQKHIIPQSKGYGKDWAEGMLTAMTPALDLRRSPAAQRPLACAVLPRSEEHTSELQSPI